MIIIFHVGTFYRYDQSIEFHLHEGASKFYATLRWPSSNLNYLKSSEQQFAVGNSIDFGSERKENNLLDYFD